jgi:hypothetical protein
MKVKLFRQYGHTVTYNYGDDYFDVPISVGVTDWEDILDADFYNLRDAVNRYNQDKKDKSFVLIIVKEHDISAAKTIDEYQKVLAKDAKARKEADEKDCRMKSRKPWWARRRHSCPECGAIYSDDQVSQMGKIFTCTRCKTVYDIEEFEELNHDKYSKQAIV